jgi:hypothetical protein
MNIPTILYGNYNDVLKQVKALKKECKNDFELLSSKINSLELRHVNEGDLVIMGDDYITRKVNNSFFPCAFSNVILYDQICCGEEISPIATWYKDIVLTKPWLLITLIAQCSHTKYLFDKVYSIKVLDAVVKNWKELLSSGTVYLNNYEHCFTDKMYISHTDGQYFWKQNLYFKKLLLHAEVSPEVLNDEDTLKNFNKNWDKLKNLFSI